ncbi:hypothetical protein [Pikeienuella sp. HZG-20]|uniref:hypothetical protein n=1 Tax=Paludibacillus litoralis TaxID=3133267 RepID=UPI0030EB9726
MLRLVLALALCIATMGSPVAAHGVGAGMDQERLIASNASHAIHAHTHVGADMAMAPDTGAPGESAQPCHCATAICAPAIAPADCAPGFTELDYTTVRQLGAPDVTAGGRDFAADPPPPRL